MQPASIHIYSHIYKKEIAALILQIQQNEFGVDITLDAQSDLLNIPSFYQHGTGNFWVALSGNKVVGTIALKDFGDSRAALRKMFVHPAFRGGPYRTGQLLLDALLLHARQTQIKEIYLGTIDQFVAARRFYERNGFVEIEKRELPSTFPLMKVDTRFYKLVITDGR